jgi:hypothetical protein
MSAGRKKARKADRESAQRSKVNISPQPGQHSPAQSNSTSRWHPHLPGAFVGLFGAFLGVALLKFGNPPIFENLVSPPANAWEFVLNSPWPLAWAYRLLFVVIGFGLLATLPARKDSHPGGMCGAIGVSVGKWMKNVIELAAEQWNSGAPRWLIALPMVWLAWQFLAATHSLDSALTGATLAHFTACVVCFYLGFLLLGRARSLALFWLGLLGAFLLMLVVGWEQHFGGLEETRRYFKQYIYPQMKEVPQEYLKKMASNRIFSTLFYPNALAGALLLLLPALLAFIGNARRQFTAAARSFLLSTIGLAAFACLYWSGSKGGWLLMLCLGLLTLLRLSLSKTIKIALLTMVFVGGLAGFFIKYADFFHRGATSVGARFDYWQAAVRTATTNPVLGTGPGTFKIPYQRIKRPEAEMTRLVHNDYLEQASDSGLPGLLFYAVFIAGTLVWTASKRVWGAGSDWQSFAIWLGLFGWALQSLFEFGLYIPALAWTAFTLLGLLVGTNSRVATND